MTPRFHRLRICDRRAETAEALSLAFAVPPELAASYRYAPGQHLTLRTSLDGEELRRSYSICAGLDDGELRIAIKQVPGGRFSTWAAQALQPGAEIDVMTPEGHFTLPLDFAQARHVVAFAAGSGITPVLALAKTLLAREPQSRFTLVYGNRRQASVMFNEALWALKDRYLARFAPFFVFSREAQEIDLFNGRIDAAKVRALTDTLIPVETIDEAFVCGPASMIDEVEVALVAAGLPAARVHVERFGTPGMAPPPVDDAQAAAAQIGVVIDGVRREVPFHPGQHSILDAARAAGVELPYSCKGGMCCTCRARLLEGEVKMARNFALTPADLAAGDVLTCQAYPLSARVLLSFDAR